jgi:hypothetical protein
LCNFGTASATRTPTLGRPEDDADQFAAHVLIRIGKDDARQLIEGAAYMYKDYVKKPTITVPVTAFADVHGAPMQRLYNLLCLAYGANSDEFSDVVDEGYLPKGRVPACKMEWNEVDFAFHKLIYPNLDQELLNDVLSKSWVPYAHICRSPRRRRPAPRSSDPSRPHRRCVDQRDAKQNLWRARPSGVQDWPEMRLRAVSVA